MKTNHSFIRSCTCRFLLNLCIVCLSLSCAAQTGFEKINTLNEDIQFDSAWQIYNTLIGRGSPADVTKAIKQLRDVASSEDNQTLWSAYYLFAGNNSLQAARFANALQLTQKALDVATREQLPEVQVASLEQLSDISYARKDTLQAFSYLLKANEFATIKPGHKSYPFMSRVIAKLGYFYFDVADTKQAKTYFLKAIRYPFSSAEYEVNVYNTLALTYAQDSQRDSAIFYFTTALRKAERAGSESWIGICSGNLGQMYLEKNRFDVALPLIRRDLTFSIRNQQWNSAAAALCALANMNLQQQKYPLASRQLDSSVRYLALQPDENSQYEYNRLRAELCNRQGKKDSVFNYLNTALQLQKKLSDNRYIFLVNHAEKQLALEKYKSQLGVLKTQGEIELRNRNYIILIVALLLVIALQMAFRLWRKHKEKQALLKETEAQLELYVKSLVNKNELIEEFKTKIEHLNETSLYHLEEQKNSITDKLKAFSILTENQWDEFRHMFDKVHKGFARKVQSEYKEITQAELRMLMLIRLSLSRKEIAEMLGISPDSVKKTRQRISKKIQLPDDQRLEDFVSSV